MNECENQSLNQPTCPPINQVFKQSINQYMYSFNQPIISSIHQSSNHLFLNSIVNKVNKYLKFLMQDGCFS